MSCMVMCVFILSLQRHVLESFEMVWEKEGIEGREEGEISTNPYHIKYTLTTDPTPIFINSH